MDIKQPSDVQRALIQKFVDILTADMFVFTLEEKERNGHPHSDVIAAMISGLGCALADFIRTAPFSQDHRDTIMTSIIHVIKMRYEHGQNMPHS